MGDPMRNRTNPLPRTGAVVRFGNPDTTARSDRTGNRTGLVREQDTKPDRLETGQPHAHEPDNRRRNRPSPELRTEAGIASILAGFDVVTVAYSRAIGRLLSALVVDETDSTVYLVPARTDTRWWRDLCREIGAVRVCFIRGRVRFGTAQTGAPFPSALVYRGSRRDEFARAARKLGIVFERYA